jgi:hypothetical protein
MIGEKSRSAATLTGRDSSSAPDHRQFTFEGLNGHHLCLALPVLGPSASNLPYGFTYRPRPWLARKISCEAAKAVAYLHSQGLCHGGELTHFFNPRLPTCLLTEEQDVAMENSLQLIRL